jgi:hypothetical protein
VFAQQIYKPQTIEYSQSVEIRLNNSSDWLDGSLELRNRFLYFYDQAVEVVSIDFRYWRLECFSKIARLSYKQLEYLVEFSNTDDSDRFSRAYVEAQRNG